MNHTWTDSAFCAGTPAAARQAVIDDELARAQSNLIVQGCDLTDADMSSMDLRRVEFRDCTFTGTNCSGATIGSICSCKLTGIHVADARIKSITNSSIENCIIERCMIGPVFAGNTVQNSEVRYTRLTDHFGINKPGANSFVKVHLCSLSAVGSNFSCFEFIQSDFANCRITRSCFAHSKFSGCSMVNVNLAGSQLSKASSVPAIKASYKELGPSFFAGYTEKLIAILTQLCPQTRYSAVAVSDSFCRSESLFVFLDTDDRYRIHSFDATTGEHLRLYGVGVRDEISKMLPYLAMDYYGWKFRNTFARNDDSNTKILANEKYRNDMWQRFVDHVAVARNIDVQPGQL